MTYTQFIAKLRVELKDFGRLDKFVIGEKWSGDGSTLLFETTYRPIKDGSYTVKVGGSTKTETTDYTLDRDLGLLDFTPSSAPGAGSKNVELLYKYVKIRDEDYLEIINDAIDYFKWIFWKMDIDIDTLTTVKDQYEYDCSGITGILYVLKAWYKDSSGSAVWHEIQGLTNWKYYTRLQKLYTEPTLDTNALPMKLLYLKSITKGTAVGDTLNIPAEWLLPFKYYIFGRYYEMLIPEKIHETAAVTTQPSFSPAQMVYNIAQSFFGKADKIATKLAPKLPPMKIKQLHQGISL